MTLESRIYSGDQARQVLENEAFAAAFAAIESEIIEQWTNPKGNEADRERLHRNLTMLRRVRDQLASMMEDGNLAKLELRHRQTAMDKLKEWIG